MSVSIQFTGVLTSVPVLCSSNWKACRPFPQAPPCCFFSSGVFFSLSQLSNSGTNCLSRVKDTSPTPSCLPDFSLWATLPPLLSPPSWDTPSFLVAPTVQHQSWLLCRLSLGECVPLLSVIWPVALSSALCTVCSYCKRSGDG